MLLAFTLSPAMGRVDEASLRARIIYLGDASLVTNRLILNWIRVEPKFTLTIVPCDLEFMTFSEAKKSTQLYLPRNYDSLNTSYDIVVLHNISPNVVPNRFSISSKKASSRKESASVSSPSCSGAEAKARTTSRPGSHLRPMIRFPRMLTPPWTTPRPGG